MTVPRGIHGRRALLVNDNTASRRMARQQLKSWGITVSTALDVGSARARLRSAAGQRRPFDVAIIDLEAPEVDGIEAVRAIKAEAAIQGTPLVLLSGLGQSLPDVVASGAVACITKPIRPSQLHDSLVNVLTGGQAESRATTPARERIRRPALEHAPRLLLAEDNLVNQKVAVRMLVRLGYRVDAVANGLEAVEALRRIPHTAVLMDGQMPEMDGYTATPRPKRSVARRPRAPLAHHRHDRLGDAR